MYIIIYKGIQNYNVACYLNSRRHSYKQHQPTVYNGDQPCSL